MYFSDLWHLVRSNRIITGRGGQDNRIRLHLADVIYRIGVVRSREQRKNIHVD